MAVRSPDGQHRMERVQAGSASTLSPPAGMGASVSEAGSMSKLGEMSLSSGGPRHHLPEFGFESRRARCDATARQGGEHTFGPDQVFGNGKGKGVESDGIGDDDNDSGMFVRGPLYSPTR